VVGEMRAVVDNMYLTVTPFNAILPNLVHGKPSPGVGLEGGVGGGKSGCLGDGNPPVRSRGKAPMRGLGDGVPQKLEHF